MIEISQFLILGVLVILWGVGALLNSATSSRRNLGWLQILLGAAVLLGAVISHFAPGTSLGVLFFIVSILTLAALITLLILTSPQSEIREVTADLQANLQNLEVKSAAELWRLVKTNIVMAEKGDFRIQIILFFFFGVIILLIQLT
ncbi:MAG: hypothetical protein A2Z27_02800 [candidate division Zixibacteria bacterium RBG_16_50_21]|nr:MAG: hypothetical protein A2Z27_02800 [candidate division Zixibacteria bacterium RBG_16_50_21]